MPLRPYGPKRRVWERELGAICHFAHHALRSMDGFLVKIVVFGVSGYG